MLYSETENFERLRKKIKEDPGSFVAIIGAGISKPAGLPDWKGLKNKLLDCYKNQCEEFNDDQAKIIENLESSTNLWSDFGQLKSILQPAEFERVIISQLSVEGKEIPDPYRLLWELGINGVVTFNIDKFILNAYSQVKKSAVDFATGFEFVKYKHFPVSNNKFVFFPHGEISNPSSWIFTEQEKSSIYRTFDFKNILSNLLNSKNLLILGFNTQEQTFISLLNDIGINGRLSGYDNYYFAPGITIYDAKRLSDLGITTINYTPSNENHPEIKQMLTTLLNYTPQDIEEASIYQGKIYSENDIPSFNNSLNVGVDKLREILNGVVANIIPPETIPSQSQIDRLQNFYNNYSAQLHIAWYVDPRSDQGNHVHNYTIVKSIGRGAFGNVYEAYDKDENKLALKILLPEVKDKARYLSCFRRGIRSMNILREHGVNGMVKIRDAFEVPACIVMDYIEGTVLRDAIDKRLIKSLDKKLEIIYKAASIINSAHQLEERILHRDIKPENIILENFYYEIDNEPLSIVILDFDLSWHKGATELTVALGAMSQGFMAPEQVEEDGRYTRNTSVDVYSIGMLFYYIITSKNPAPYQHNFAHFKEDLIKEIETNYKLKWKCFSIFIADSIVNSTKHKQADRLPLNLLIENIKIAKEMLLSETIPNSHPLLLNELACRIDRTAEISISDFGRTVTMQSPQLGKSISLSLGQWYTKTIIKILVRKVRKEFDVRDNISKYLENARVKAVSVIDRSIFYYSNSEIGTGEITIELATELPDNVNLKKIRELAKNIQEIRAKLDLS